MVTITKNFTTIIEHIPISDVFAIIKNEKSESESDLESIKKMRQHFEKGEYAAYDFMKRQLNAFIVTGVYKGPLKDVYLIESLKEYSKMICIDYDDIPTDDLLKVKKEICNSPYTLGCFISPSGHGLKVICKVSTDEEYHKMAYQQVMRYYDKLTGLEADPVCCNITRLCYYSHDPDLYYNPGSDVYSVDMSYTSTQSNLFVSIEDIKKGAIKQKELDLLSYKECLYERF